MLYVDSIEESPTGVTNDEEIRYACPGEKSAKSYENSQFLCSDYNCKKNEGECRINKKVCSVEMDLFQNIQG
jgi:hypothetical protein